MSQQWTLSYMYTRFTAVFHAYARVCRQLHILSLSKFIVKWNTQLSQVECTTVILQCILISISIGYEVATTVTNKSWGHKLRNLSACFTI